MDIDAIIAEANVSVEAQTEPKTEVKADATEEQTETTEVATEPQAEGKTEEKAEVLFPKKAVNAISYRDKKIGKQAERIRALTQEVEALRAKAPKEEDFEGKPYGDLLKAEAEHAAETKFKTEKLKEIESEDAEEKSAWEAERKQNFSTKLNES